VIATRVVSTASYVRYAPRSSRAIFKHFWIPSGRPTRRPTRTNLPLRFDANPFIDRRPNTLLAAEVSLRRLNRDVPKNELDLFQFAALGVTQPSTRPPQVMRRQLLNSGFPGVLTNHIPHSLFP